MLREELMLDYYPGALKALRARGFNTRTLNPWQKAAILSFAYNCGNGSISGHKQASWPQRLLDGDTEGAKRSWCAWNKGDGKVLGGLVRRRFAEWELLTKCEWSEQPPGWREYYNAHK